MFQVPAPTGLITQYVGVSGGATARYYWVQAIYPSGLSPLAGPVLATAPASLTNDNRVQISWNPSPGAIGYRVFETATTTAPTSGAVLVGITDAATTLLDNGQTYGTALITYGPGMFVARARYNFAVDGGGAPGLITVVDTDTIPAGAMVLDGFLYVPTAPVGASATVAIGTSAGSAANSLLAALAITSLGINVILKLIPRTTPFRMSAAGTITVTTATTALTAGVIEIYVIYMLATAP